MLVLPEHNSRPCSPLSVFLRELLREPGNWKSSSDIGQATQLKGVRFDRVLRVLPSPIKSEIESNRRKGYGAGRRGQLRQTDAFRGPPGIAHFSCRRAQKRAISTSRVAENPGILAKFLRRRNSRSLMNLRPAKGLRLSVSQTDVFIEGQFVSERFCQLHASRPDSEQERQPTARPAPWQSSKAPALVPLSRRAGHNEQVVGRHLPPKGFALRQHLQRAQKRHEAAFARPLAVPKRPPGGSPFGLRAEVPEQRRKQPIQLRLRQPQDRGHRSRRPYYHHALRQ
jgi:hypothetical protein